MIVDKEHPWLHATPDFMAFCSCFGDRCGEVKCPYSIVSAKRYSQDDRLITNVLKKLFEF